jgi:hypothetical protein
VLVGRSPVFPRWIYAEISLKVIHLT